MLPAIFRRAFILVPLFAPAAPWLLIRTTSYSISFSPLIRFSGQVIVFDPPNPVKQGYLFSSFGFFQNARRGFPPYFPFFF